MQLRTVPAARGALWVRQGFSVFFSRPMSFMALFGVVLLGMVVTQVLPWIGPLLFWSALPLVTLGFMLASQQALQGRVPTPTVFVAPMRGPGARALWQMGAVYAVAMLLVTVVYGLIDGGRAQALQTEVTSGKGTPESVATLFADARLQFGLLWFAGAATIVSLPFWHAPALVHWAGHSVGKALFASTVACWRNKGAFAVYSLTFFGAIMVFAVVSSLSFSLFGLANVAPVAMAPAMLLFFAVFYASLYFTFADCFEPPEPLAPLAAPTDKDPTP